ncbi:MAG: 3-dehydroquinate synthase [Candidatus Omnitrophica bacterium]|nr:3-dehydroquinate synthase [Candidatus Omnitrophota bacterium]
MNKVRVNLGERTYEIFIGRGTLARLPGFIRSMGFKGPVVCIADSSVLSKTKALIRPAFAKVRNRVHWISVPGTEKSKSLKVYRETVHKISSKTKMHRPLIIALGGGVIGDLAGFVAATYRRGVPYIQIPTTLLAQVDSSIGGKVGVDLPEAKNLIGAFKQPEAVFIDIDFLKTLPVKQLYNGLAEVIKYGIIKSRSFFLFLEGNMEKLLSLNRGVLEKVILECVFIKSKIVEKDEFDDKRLRIVLNFGHTLGHAVEAAAGYTNAYNHGESVAVGMLLAGEIALRLDMLAAEDLGRIGGLIRSAGLPVRIENVSLAKIMSAYMHDKKFTGGTNRFVLPRKIGSVEVVEDIPETLIKSVLRDHAV